MLLPRFYLHKTWLVDCVAVSCSPLWRLTALHPPQALPANMRDGQPEGQQVQAAPPPASERSRPLRELQPDVAAQMLSTPGSCWSYLDVRTPGACRYGAVVSSADIYVVV